MSICWINELRSDTLTWDNITLRVPKTVSSPKCPNIFFLWYWYDFVMIWAYDFFMIWIWWFFDFMICLWFSYDFHMFFLNMFLLATVWYCVVFLCLSYNFSHGFLMVLFRVFLTLVCVFRLDCEFIMVVLWFSQGLWWILMVFFMSSWFPHDSNPSMSLCFSPWGFNFPFWTWWLMTYEMVMNLEHWTSLLCLKIIMLVNKGPKKYANIGRIMIYPPHHHHHHRHSQSPSWHSFSFSIFPCCSLSLSLSFYFSRVFSISSAQPLLHTHEQTAQCQRRSAPKHDEPLP